MTDFLAEKRREIDARMVELKPRIDEYALLEQAQAALAKIPAATNGASAVSPARRGPGRPRKNVAKPASQPKAAATTKATIGRSKRPGRRPGSGKRAAEALAAITEQPGITVAEMAKKLGMKPNYLYRVLPTLQAEGKIAKKGRGYQATT